MRRALASIAILIATATLPARAQTTRDTLATLLRETAADRWYKNCFIYNLGRHFFARHRHGCLSARHLFRRTPFARTDAFIRRPK